MANFPAGNQGPAASFEEQNSFSPYFMNITTRGRGGVGQSGVGRGQTLTEDSMISGDDDLPIANLNKYKGKP
jgi:hypothetical protein